MDTKDYKRGLATDAYNFFGAHKKDTGYIFRTYAPNASKVHIMGDFNDWQKERLRGYATGVYSISCKEAKPGDRYQYVITNSDGSQVKKIDPFAREILIDENCSLISESTYEFTNKRIDTDIKNIYEVHMGSLLKSYEDFDNLSASLVSHVKENNFTHISFMPMTEYLNYKSMGYASSGLFALSARYGNADDFKKLIDMLHAEGIGVIVELDIAEFDPYSYYLNNFDGSNLYGYDYEDVRYNYYGSMNFDPSKATTKSYLKSVINYWLEEFNIDGINLSNLENIIYWQGDKGRGKNDEFVSLLKDLISQVHKSNRKIIASFNGFYDLDLDFDLVFDNSIRPIIRIMQRPAEQRDNFRKEVNTFITKDNSKKILGFNHVDAYLNEARVAMKMNGDWAKINQLKALVTLIYSLNSSKILFMGDELSNFKTWSVYEGIDFNPEDEYQDNFNQYYKDLSKLVLTNEVLKASDSNTKSLDIEGFSIYAYIREFNNDKVLVIVNLTDIDYYLKAPRDMEELINTEDLAYGGSGNLNGRVSKSDYIKIMPYGACIFQLKNGEN